jgi:hypothetical protein
MPRFEPTDDERRLVKLLMANGFAQHVVGQYISNRRGPHTSESTLKRAFTQELKARMVELCASWRGSCGRWRLISASLGDSLAVHDGQEG